MNIYKVEQDINDEYDTFDSFVCIAETETEARYMHPDPFTFFQNGTWHYSEVINGELFEDDGLCGWIEPEKVKVTLIGVANSDQVKSIVCSSFNAG